MSVSPSYSSLPYVKVKGKTLYRAVDSKGNTLDCLLTAKRDKQAALRCLKKTLGSPGKPEQITIDKSGANTAAIKASNEEPGSTIVIRQNKYKDTIVEQDYGRTNRITQSILGFKNFHCAQKT